MKRLLALLLSAVILILSLASCAKAPEAEENPNLNTAETLAAYMKKVIAENPGLSDEKLAALYVTHPYVKDMDLEIYSEDCPTDYEPFLMGVSESYEIPAFQSVTHITPNIFPNLYVSHLIHLKEGTDAAAYAEDLLKNADLAFNVCMVSDEAAVCYEGEYVFFVITGARTEK